LAPPPPQADSFDEADSPDYVRPGAVYDVGKAAAGSGGGGGGSGSGGAAGSTDALVRKEKSALRRYIEKFDQATMVGGAGGARRRRCVGPGSAWPGRPGLRVADLRLRSPGLGGCALGAGAVPLQRGPAAAGSEKEAQRPSWLLAPPPQVETARIVSQEGAALVERQTTALFGDIKQLTQEMQVRRAAPASQPARGDTNGGATSPARPSAARRIHAPARRLNPLTPHQTTPRPQEACRDVASAEELMQRMMEAVAGDKVPTLRMSVGTQRRAVLEAVSYGTFLRDVEEQVQADYSLLTPLPPPTLPPGAGGAQGRL
jgi:hypothetical protein